MGCVTESITQISLGTASERTRCLDGERLLCPLFKWFHLGLESNRLKAVPLVVQGSSDLRLDRNGSTRVGAPVYALRLHFTPSGKTFNGPFPSNQSPCSIISMWTALPAKVTTNRLLVREENLKQLGSACSIRGTTIFRPYPEIFCLYPFPQFILALHAQVDAGNLTQQQALDKHWNVLLRCRSLLPILSRSRMFPNRCH